MQIGNFGGDDAVQVITLIICLIGIVMWLRWGRGRMGYVVSPVLFLTHQVIYYVVITLDRNIPSDAIAIWSSAISLHAAITIASAAAPMIVIMRRRGAGHE